MKKTKNRLAVRFRNIHMLFIVLILLIIMIVSAVMIFTLTDSAAKSNVHSYTMETVHILASYLNREITLIQQAAETREIIEWFADEKNPQKRYNAYQRMMHYADILQIGSVYFVISSSLDEYSIDSGTHYTDFIPFDVIEPENLYDQWFFEAINSNFDFTLNLDVDKVTNTRRIWINYKVMDNGKPLGIFCSALQFDDVFTDLFSQYDRQNVIGYIIDENGFIQMSSYVPEPDLMHHDYTIHDIDEEQHIQDVNPDSAFIAAINIHLENPKIHHSPRIETSIMRLASGNYQYVSIAPIPNTNWFTVTFFSSSELFEITSILIPIIIVVLSFIIYVAASSLLTQRLVFKPLQLFTESVSGLDFTDIYGTSRDDEFGELARAAKKTLKNLRDTAEKLEEARNEAETASRSKSIFLANMSHEIRTPMNAILGVTEIMIQNETLPAEIEEGLERIYSSCDMLLGIINDILDFSKIEAGKLDIIPSLYKVASLLNDSAQLNMMRMNGKPIEFELQADKNIPAKLLGDELRIKQILNNLLSNAFKYTDTGRVILSATSEPEPEKNGITLVLKVQDTGHGMTKEQLEKLYSEYSRFNEENRRTVEGTGLGLAITHRLIRLMNGEIYAESTPGIGSLFTVKLPQEKVDNEVLGAEVAENLRQFRMNYITHRQRGQVTRDPMPYGSVLVVDDVETNLYVAAGLMKLYKLQIDTVISGKEAIEKIKNGNVYDIVFMDHMMPEMDGIETTQKIREWESKQNAKTTSTSFVKDETRSNDRNSFNESMEFPKETPKLSGFEFSEGKRIPIVALTANAVAGQADIFLKSGFDDFISKPIDIRQLDTVLNRYVRDKQPPEIIEAARQQKNSENTNSRSENQLYNRMLLESFIRDAQKAETLLNELFQKADFENEENLHRYAITVHGMKSSLWNIGEKSLSELAHKLEQAARNQNIDFIKTSTPGFFTELNALLKKHKIEAVSETADDNIDDLRNQLQIIRKMCADYDRKGILDNIGNIKKCSAKTMAVMDMIKEFIMHSHFDEAESVAAAYLVEL